MNICTIYQTKVLDKTFVWWYTKNQNKHSAQDIIRCNKPERRNALGGERDKNEQKHSSR